MEFHYGQDSYDVKGVNVSSFRLEKGDLKYSKKKNQEVFDFVGFILDENNLLSVFPKHFYSHLELENMNRSKSSNIEDIKLLFDVFIKYTKEVDTKAKANKYMGANPEFESDYPFAAFFEVYKYYRQYGIYRESNVEVKANANGTVAWKKTIQKSQTIISDGNLIFTPLYRKKKSRQNVFLSECMTFVIDHTITSFPYLLNLPKTGHTIGSFDFIKHREYTLQQLRQINNKTFKDSHKKLIAYLIKFFEEYKKAPKGGNIHIKINYFDKIWERMVSNYLNKYFKYVDEASDSIIFDASLLVSPLQFTSESLAIDDSPNGFEIRLDHYVKQDNAIYIFDSKYYDSVSDLNYKQFSYDEILRGKLSEDDKMYSALILPARFSSSKLHFSLDSGYIGDRKTGTKIIEQYLYIKEVMQAYLLK